MAYCNHCGSQLADDTAFCGKCGTAIHSTPQKKVCPNCKNEMAEDMLFCDRCGTKYIAQKAPAQSPSYPHQNVQHQTPPRQGVYAVEQAAPSVNTTGLMVLTILCILFFWPVSFYGYACYSRAKKATTQEEAEAAVKKGSRACGIAIGIMAFIYMIALAS